MTLTFKRFITATALIIAVILPSSAQFRFGLRAGATVNKFHMSKDIVSSENRTGFTGGITTEFTVPIVNLGFDASLLYTRRAVEIDDKTTSNRDYINIPVNFKYKLSLPGVGAIVAPYVTTGPDFSFLISKRNFDNAWKNRKFDTAWTFGFGLELLKHLQIGASYGIGLTKSASSDNALYGSNRFWTVAASYYF